MGDDDFVAARDSLARALRPTMRDLELMEWPRARRALETIRVAERNAARCVPREAYFVLETAVSTVLDVMSTRDAPRAAHHLRANLDRARTRAAALAPRPDPVVRHGTLSRVHRLAFTALLAPEFGGEKEPWIIGLAEEDSPDYWPQVGWFGAFATEAEARSEVDALNDYYFGLTPKEAVLIVLSSMGASRSVSA